MIGTFPLLNNNQKHEYYNILSYNNASYDISFDDTTEIDNIFLNCKKIIFTDTSTKTLEEPTKYDIDFTDILHYYSLKKNNISDLDTKNELIQNFYFFNTNSSNNSLEFSLLPNVLNNNRLILDLFSFFKNVDINNIKVEDKNNFCDIYQYILKYFCDIFNRDDIAKIINEYKPSKQSNINIPVILRIKLCVNYKTIKIEEYKLSLFQELLNNIKKTTIEYIEALNKPK